MQIVMDEEYNDNKDSMSEDSDTYSENFDIMF